MEPIHLKDGTLIDGEINGIDLADTSGDALLVPTGEARSLTKRLAASVEIQGEHVNQAWRE